MSLLPDKAIDEFQALWRQKFGAELPREQAVIVAHRLLTLVATLTRPMDTSLLRQLTPQPPALQPQEALKVPPDSQRSLSAPSPQPAAES